MVTLENIFSLTMCRHGHVFVVSSVPTACLYTKDVPSRTRALCGPVALGGLVVGVGDGPLHCDVVR